MLGTIGQLLILTAFVACGLAGFAYLQAAKHENSTDWNRIGRGSWGVLCAAIFGAAGILWYLLLTHQFEYAYVYENSSRALPLHYLISSFWAGQEGSFLLWILMNSVVGLALMRWARGYEAPTLAVVSFCQLFLISMIVGLKLGPVPIGASPFVTLVEKFPTAPMLQAGLIPQDGEGLNDLLQNYWMAIHPPTLFSGFAAMIVPFAFAVTALWKKKYTEWVRPALPWTIVAVMLLGVGIALGGYWAYVTLSFGGYWAWDPVENSSLVPWIVGIAAIHTMIVQKKSGSSHKAALFLTIFAYMLVIYSTFLTRSGILGDISVHSFVDLGLYNQLLLWILAMGVVGFGLFAYRYRELPTPEREPNMLSREFMIFSGAMLLCAVGAVVLLGTSAPILGRIFRDNPSSVPLAFYNQWTLPLSIGFVFLAGLGQLFWWNKMSVENLNRVLLKPIVLSVLSTIVILVFTPFVERSVTIQPALATAPTMGTEAGLLGGLGEFWGAYGTGLLLLLLVFVAFFAFYGNGFVLWRIGRGNPRLAGGALTHIGFAILVLGVVASSGFSNALSAGTGVDMGNNRDNFILERGQTKTIEGYRVSYVGQERSDEGHPAYVLDFVDQRGRAFRVKPVAYLSNKEQWIQHPDLHMYVEKDIFVAVSPNVMFDGNRAGQGGEFQLVQGDSTTLGNDEYRVRFVGFDLNIDQQHITDSTEIAVSAELEVTRLASGERRTLRPIYMVMQDRSVQFIQNRVPDWDLSLTFAGMNVDNGAITLVVEGVDVAPEDWLVVQAYEKPFINLVWIGIIMLSFGFLVSAYRRIKDHQFHLQHRAA